MKRKLLSFVTVVLVSLLVTVSCTPSQPSTSITSPTTTPFRIGFNNWPGCIPLQVSQIKKFFDANQVNVDLRCFNSYLDSIKALSSGYVDASDQTLSDTITAVANGSEQVTVLVIDNSTGSDAVIVSKKINSVADLKVKKLLLKRELLTIFFYFKGLKKLV